MSAAQIHDNAAWTRAQPVLSVLIPFLRDDPASLLTLLDREGAALNGQVELVLLDDGTAVTVKDVLAQDDSAAVNYMAAGVQVTLAKAVSPAGPVKPGDTLTYTVTAANTLTDSANGTVVRLKGKGFPVYKQEGKFGDLLITYAVKLPVHLTDKQRELFKQLAST